MKINNRGSSTSLVNLFYCRTALIIRNFFPLWILLRTSQTPAKGTHCGDDNSRMSDKHTDEFQRNQTNSPSGADFKCPRVPSIAGQSKAIEGNGLSSLACFFSFPFLAHMTCHQSHSVPAHIQTALCLHMQKNLSEEPPMALCVKGFAATEGTFHSQRSSGWEFRAFGYTDTHRLTALRSEPA